MEKMWSGRFKKQNSQLMERFNRSLSFDIRLYEEDIECNKASALALKKAGILSGQECVKIRKALDDIRKEIESGRVKFLLSDEDIHMAIERLLTEKLGAAGAKIHTGRSRNDQVATDMRLYIMKIARRVSNAIIGLQGTLLERAKEHRKTIMPGYTHLQQAQPVSLAHYLLSFIFALERDLERLSGVYNCADIMPLGSGALAGSGIMLDRRLLSNELGFSWISGNSMDAVSSRDFVIEFLSAAAVLMMHLSRYAEDLIIWSSAEFGFVELADEYSTGSSMMPQKKNPDSLELIRGKTGRVYGNLMQLLTVMKGLPLTYAKDLQEDKECLFDSADTLLIVLPVMDGVIGTMEFKVKRMEESLSELLLATDIADYLAERGVPFRKAHAIVGKITRLCLEKKKSYSRLSLKEWQGFSKHFDKSFISSLTFEQSLKQRNIVGGTGDRSVGLQIKKAEQTLKNRSRQ
jgi:argininosuccinate lyase